MAQEDAIVVNPPQELETNNESELTPVDGPRGTANARTETEPQAQRTFTFSKHDIKAIADETLQEAIDKGEFDGIVEANPTLEGGEPDLESLKVAGAKYKVGGGTNVIANPTIAGTEPDLESLQVGEDKFKVGGGKLYVHKISLNTGAAWMDLFFYSTKDTKFTYAEWAAAIRDGKIGITFLPSFDTQNKYVHLLRELTYGRNGVEARRYNLIMADGGLSSTLSTFGPNEWNSSSWVKYTVVEAS